MSKQTEKDAYQEWVDKWNTRLIFGTPNDDAPDLVKYARHVKLAWVMISGKRYMIGVHNEDMKGYAMDEKYPTIKKPLEPINYDTFERWCTTMDL